MKPLSFFPLLQNHFICGSYNTVLFSRLLL